MDSKHTIAEIRKPVQAWLLVGVIMVFFQVVIGGVTRLTDSGLSITEWAVIQGTIPPLNELEWQLTFDKYRVAAKKQYESLHGDMTLDEFKIIFFWEYAHRLWARLMVFVFLFPCLAFLWKKWLPGWLLRRLGTVIGLAILAAVFGWIMVASGLNDDKRTWVSAYKLVIHLAIAAALFGYLFWTWLRAYQPVTFDMHLSSLKKLAWAITVVLFLQFLLGGLMAGMRAAMIHPHFPVFVEGGRLWNILMGANQKGVEGIIDYERHGLVKVVVQLLHRFTAFVLVVLTLFFAIKVSKENVSKNLRFGNRAMIIVLGIQFLFGVLTVINSGGFVPLLYGVTHQAGALILLAVVVFVNYQFRGSKHQ